MTTLASARDELATNERQWEAFSTTGHCVVLAPPGSGKTKLLTTRLAHDLATSISRPHGAACITLTNAAADELERRLVHLGVERRSTLFVGTVHSFALTRVVLPFAVVAGKTGFSNPRVASNQQARTALKRAIDEIYRDEDSRYVESTVTRLRKRMDPNEWERTSDRIIRVNELYERFLREDGLVDFDDIIACAVELVEGYTFVRRTLTARYPCLYVDEYQDLAPGLDRLVKALCFDNVPNAELFAVGDRFQSIYGWTGSRPELLEGLARRPDVSAIELDINYRSGSEIIRMSSLVLQEDRHVRGLREGGIVRGHYIPEGFDSQLAQSADLIKKQHNDGTSYDEIAVLCHTNAECRQAAEALRADGLPVFVRDNDEYRLSPATLMIEALAAWAILPRGQSGHRLGELLRRWRMLVGGEDTPLVRVLLDWRQCGSEPATLFLDALDNLGLERALLGPSRADDALEVEKMRRSLSTGKLAGMTLAGLAERAKALGRVFVTTMTSSKGLEFDVVLMLGVEQGKIPHFSSRSEEELEEDRRKFYVSITRARNEVHIFYSGWYVASGGWTFEDGPSPFLADLGLR